MTLYLGVGDPGWVARPELAGIPICVSRNRLRKCRTIRHADGPILLDSGGFTELKDHGRWRISPAEYVAEVRAYVQALGPDRVVGIAQQDWMCEPTVIEGGHTKDGLFVGTGLSVAEHQARTVANFVELRRIAPDLPIFPVLQGWELPDYIRCVFQFAAAGVDLRAEPLVGLGSVCRRQGTAEIGRIVETLEAMGLRLHGFGVKTEGIAVYGALLDSADSQAWSYAARRQVGRCPHGTVRWEQNCPVGAASWWRRITGRAATAQPALDLAGPPVDPPGYPGPWGPRTRAGAP